MDENLLQQCAAGDEEAWAEVHRTYGERVFVFCHANTRSYHEAEDAASEVWRRVVRGLRKFGGDPERFVAWIYTIARHVCIDCAKKRRGQESEVPLEQEGESGETPVERQLVDPSGTPSEGADQRDRKALIDRMLTALGADCRLALLLRYFEGRKEREIAEILGEPIGTVAARITRCKQKARELMQEIGLRDSLI